MQTLLRIFLSWLPFAIVITGVCLLVYATEQQSYRQNANDPQIQMAEDAAAAIQSGEPANEIIPFGDVETVDIVNSLAPWVALYSATGTPLVSTGELNGAMPQLPTGVFDTSQWDGPIIGHHLNTNPANEDRLTWQPEQGLRQAVVLVHLATTTDSGVAYVASGRNLREVEDREGVLATMVWSAWLVIMLGTLGAVALARLVS